MSTTTKKHWYSIRQTTYWSYLNETEKEFTPFGLILTAVLSLATFIVLVVVGANAATHYSCYKNAQTLGYDYKYSFWTTCYIKPGPRWIPYDRWVNYQNALKNN